jgi:hypothetical protein
MYLETNTNKRNSLNLTRKQNQQCRNPTSSYESRTNVNILLQCNDKMLRNGNMLPTHDNEGHKPKSTPKTLHFSRWWTINMVVTEIVALEQKTHLTFVTELTEFIFARRKRKER